MLVEASSPTTSSSTPELEVAALERRQSSCSLKRIKVLSPEERMRQNLLTMWEHVGFKPGKLADQTQRINPSPLELFCTTASLKGRRPHMEDVDLVMASPNRDGHLVAIFDGHGGRAVAEKVASIFRERFFAAFEQNRYDPIQVFTDFCLEAQKETPEILAGSTGLFAHFDEDSNYLTVGNVGDSELHVYKKTEDGVIGIPVSDARNWTHPEEEARYLSVVDDEEMKAAWLAIDNPDNRRFPGVTKQADGTIVNGGVNAPRVFGGKLWWHTNKEGQKVTAFSSEPIVTCFQPESGDKIVLACDGIWKAVNEQRLIDEVITPHWDAPDLATRIIKYAYNVGSTDNLTAIVANVAQKVLAEAPTTLPVE